MAASNYAVAFAIVALVLCFFSPTMKTYAQPVGDDECSSMLDYILGNPNLSAMATIIDYFEVADRFSDPLADQTVFAFTDSAFDLRLESIGAPAGTPVAATLSRVPKDRFDAAFGHHVVLAGKDVDTLLEEKTIMTNATGPIIPELDVYEEDGAVYVDSGTNIATVLDAVEGCLWYIYIVDRVLIPAGDLPPLTPEVEEPAEEPVDE